jgi:hypothetical protein
MKAKRKQGEWLRGHTPHNKFKKVPLELGQKFGKWTVVSLTPFEEKTPHLRVKCRCDCGAIAKPIYASLRNGRSAQCTHCTRVLAGGAKAFKTWGRKPDAEDFRMYDRWWNIRDRCEKSRNIGWNCYGGRGIKLSKEFHNYVVFTDYCRSLPSYAPGLEIDRIDVNGNYERGNLRFSTKKEQAMNRRNTARLIVAGVEMTVKALVASGRCRFSYGWIIALRAQGYSGDEIMARSAIVD